MKRNLTGRVIPAALALALAAAPVNAFAATFISKDLTYGFSYAP